MRLHPIVFLYNTPSALHAAQDPRTPTDREREKEKLYRTCCGRPTDRFWQRPGLYLAHLIVKHEVMPVCAVCFPRGLEDA